MFLRCWDEPAGEGSGCEPGGGYKAAKLQSVRREVSSAATRGHRTSKTTLGLPSKRHVERSAVIG